MKPHVNLTQSEQAEWLKLSAMAREIEDKLSSLALATVQSSIPDEYKGNVLDWVNRAETFNGLSYFLTPQSEWLGGSDDNAKWAVRLPHICDTTKGGAQ